MFVPLDLKLVVVYRDNYDLVRKSNYKVRLASDTFEMVFFMGGMLLA